MRRIERRATITAMFAVGRVAAPASSPADHASTSILSSAILAASAVVAILGVLLLLIGPAVLLAGDVAGLAKKLDTTAAVGG